MSDEDLKLIGKIKRKRPSNIAELRISPVERTQSREFVKKMVSKPEWDRLVGNTIGTIKQYKPMIRSLDAYKVLMKNPDYFMNILNLQFYLAEHSTILEREREILILRIAWLSGSEYMWFQHKAIGFAVAGLSVDEIERIKTGPDAEKWEDNDATLLRAVDELHNDAFISDTTWKALAEQNTEDRIIDLLGLVTLYFGIAMLLKTLGVQPEPDRLATMKK
ncbi:MAG: carboxymuconolactone decarboxylase family protein [Promethearchaeota archaeon]